MPCLWIHRASGSDFLVRGDKANLMKLSRDILMEDADSVYMLDDNNIGYSSNVQISLEEDGFLPERRFYNEISYVTSSDAYKMCLSDIFPENHFRGQNSSFKLPKGFIIRSRDEPYDFTTPKLTHEQLDKQLEDNF